jgi:hypothetical protein
MVGGSGVRLPPMSAGQAEGVGTAAHRVAGFVRKWSRTAALAVAIVVVVAELAATFGVIGDYARFGWRSVRTPTPLVRDADLDPLAQFVPTSALVHAAQTIPSGATYAIVVGNDPPVELPGDVRAAFRFWLPPRRYTERAADADWIIAFHKSSEGLGVKVAREIGLSPYVNAVEVER